MKKIFGIALVALPLAAVSVRADFQAGGSFYIRGSSSGIRQAGPWYLYWPLEAHFVAPAPTGYPYWPGPMGLPPGSFGGPACPPGAPCPPGVVARPPAPIYAPAPAPVAPAPAGPTLTPPAAQTAPRLAVPPYLQPTGYAPVSYTGQVPSYWYER